jgi:hypothetical protein
LADFGSGPKARQASVKAEKLKYLAAIADKE